MTKADDKIVVLKGGISAEREVSLRSGAAVAEALREAGATVEELDVTDRDFVWTDAGAVHFVCLHGTFGEDGELQERMEREGVCFTGEGADVCRMAFDKLASKTRFRDAGLPVPEGGAWDGQRREALPCVVKPVADGSSVGVHLIRSEADWEAAENEQQSHGGGFMIESLVEGRELTVGILGDEALPVVEVKPMDGFYDYKHKYTDGLTQHLCPAPLDPEERQTVQEAALAAHRALGGRVYSRVDIILTSDGTPCVLEVNTIPGMTRLSLLPEAGTAAGYSFSDLCFKIIELSKEVRS